MAAMGVIFLLTPPNHLHSFAGMICGLADGRDEDKVITNTKRDPIGFHRRDGTNPLYFFF
jgi:hypothetical protein